MKRFALVLLPLVGAAAITALANLELTFRTSINYLGAQANEKCDYPVVSATGRLIAFHGWGSNLVEGDTNNVGDAFLRDLATGKITRVSVGDHGQQGNSGSAPVSISANDRFVLFYSGASNLVPGDSNRLPDLFVRDLWLNTTERVSLGNGGVQSNGNTGLGALSGDGRFVVFESDATNLVEGDTNASYDVFVYDRETRDCKRISVSSSGEEGNTSSTLPSIAPDGRFVCFTSYASNLVEGDTNQSQDVFLHDRWTGITERVSVSSAGAQGNSDSGGGIPNTVTPDGRYVGFNSTASNLVTGDTNRVGDGFVRDRWLGTTIRVSIRSDGGQGNHGGGITALSADGHFALLGSPSTNLTDDGDVNDRLLDIFMHDMWTGETWRISNNTNGEQGNAQSEACVMSANGMIVAFASNATNLAPNDTNGFMDIFVHINVRLRR